MQPDPKDKPHPSDAAHTVADDQRDRGYYYDDSHGYEEYQPEAERTILTIGHSTREFDEFAALLKENDVERIVDVRSFPGSRKFPQYNKENLEVTLPERGIEYIHMKSLGGRRRVRPDSKHTVWRNESFRGYADYMETDEFKKGIEELLELAEEKGTAIMCSEAVWWRCHRSMISDYLKSIDVTVRHILGPGKAEEHPYTSAAKIVDGQLLYGTA